MNIFDSQISYLRNAIFHYPLIEEIDDDLILLSIIEPQSLLNKSLKDRLTKKYQSENYDRLEFLGDAVLELLISDLLFKKGLSEVGKMSQMRSVIVRNVSLICLMNDKTLCNINAPINKSCADIFESIVGAVYIHLNQYEVNPIKIMTQWLIDIWNIDYIIDDIIDHPKDENVCPAIQRSYGEFLSMHQPYFGYIKSYYEQLQKIYEYYKLGQIEMVQQFNKQSNLWTVRIFCPLTLGCQFYNNKQGDKKLLGFQSDQNKQQAVEKASKQAIDIILNDYELIG